MSKTSTEGGHTKIIAELNNAHENFKVADLPRENTRAVDDGKSRNFQNMAMLTTAVTKLQHDPSDASSRWVLSKWNSDQRQRNRTNEREIGTGTFPEYFLDLYEQAHDLRRQYSKSTDETKKSELLQQFKNINVETTTFCKEYKIPSSWAWQDQEIDQKHDSPPISAESQGTEVTQVSGVNSKESKRLELIQRINRIQKTEAVLYSEQVGTEVIPYSCQARMVQMPVEVKRAVGILWK